MLSAACITLIALEPCFSHASIILKQDNSFLLSQETQFYSAIQNGENVISTLEKSPSPFEDWRSFSRSHSINIDYGDDYINVSGSGEVGFWFTRDSVFSTIFEVRALEPVIASISFGLSSRDLDFSAACDSPFDRSGATSVTLKSLSPTPYTRIQAGISTYSDGNLDGVSCAGASTQKALYNGVYLLEARTNFKEWVETISNAPDHNWASYSLNISFSEDISAVPIPAAAWFFISAIGGLIGMSRLNQVKRPPSHPGISHSLSI